MVVFKKGHQGGLVISRIAKKVPAYKERRVTLFSESGRGHFLESR
jgi:hypothetical protein